MKKSLLFLAAMAFSGILKAQIGDCNELIISEYVEGWNNNKSMELYNPTNHAITLDNTYQLIRWSNGNAVANLDMLYVLPLVGTIEPYKVMVMIQDTIPAGQDTMVWPALRAKGTWLAPYDYGGTTPGGNVVFWNGDDAISLQKKINNVWVDVDIFGEIGVRPLNWQGGTSPVGAWTDTKPYWQGTGRYLTKSKTLIRKPNILKGVSREVMNTYGSTSTGGFPDSFFALAEYDSLPANFFDSLGFHTCNCKPALGIKNQAQEPTVNIYPNPVTGDHFLVTATLPVVSVEVYSVLGQTVFQNENTSQRKEMRVTITGQQSGFYFVKIKLLNNQVITRKILVQ
jgi:hypothetical protein